MAACSGGQTLTQASNSAIQIATPAATSSHPFVNSPTPAPGGRATPPAVPTAPAATPTAPSAGNATGILIPLYESPTAWSTVVSLKLANPNMPIAAIINPNNGPGNASQSSYALGAAQLQAAGVLVLGYVDTNFAGTSSSSAKSQISDYAQWYATNGIFFDNMAYVAGSESYYSSLTQYAKSLGMTKTIGNPGTDTVPTYIGTVDTMVIYENSGYPASSFLGGWHTSYPKSNFAFIAYGVSSLNASLSQSEAAYVQYEYVTDKTEPNPYGVLPSYVSTELSGLLAQ